MLIQTIEQLVNANGTWITDKEPVVDSCVPVYDLIYTDSTSGNASLLNISAAPFAIPDDKNLLEYWTTNTEPITDNSDLNKHLMGGYFGKFGDSYEIIKGIGNLYVLNEEDRNTAAKIDFQLNLLDGRKEPYSISNITNWKKLILGKEHKISACMGIFLNQPNYNYEDEFRMIGEGPTSGCPIKSDSIGTPPYYNYTVDGSNIYYEHIDVLNNCKGTKKISFSGTGIDTMYNRAILKCYDSGGANRETAFNENKVKDVLNVNVFNNGVLFPRTCYKSIQEPGVYGYVVDEYTDNFIEICSGYVLMFGMFNSENKFSIINPEVNGDRQENIDSKSKAVSHYKLLGYYPASFWLQDNIIYTKVCGNYNSKQVSTIGEVYGFIGEQLNSHCAPGSEYKSDSMIDCLEKHNSNECTQPPTGSIKSCLYMSVGPNGEAKSKFNEITYNSISTVKSPVPGSDISSYIQYDNDGMITECNNNLQIYFPTIDFGKKTDDYYDASKFSVNDCNSESVDLDINSPSVLPVNNKYIKIVGNPLDINDSGQTKEMYEKCGGDHSKGFYDNLCYCTDDTLYYDSYFLKDGLGGCEHTGIIKSDKTGTCSPVSSAYGINPGLKDVFSSSDECTNDLCSPACCYGAADGSYCSTAASPTGKITTHCAIDKCICTDESTLCGPYCSEKCGYCDGESENPIASDNGFIPYSPGIKQEDKEATLSYLRNSPYGCSEFIVESPTSGSMSYGTIILVLSIIILVSATVVFIYYHNSINSGTKKNISSGRYFNNF